MNTKQFDGHTPGPWDTLVCATTGEKFVIDGPEDTAWNSLALVDRVGEDEGWKNMALMAAAPDLLAEVKRLHGWLDKEKNTCPLCFGKIAWGLDKDVELRHCEDCDYDSPYGGEQE